MPRGEKKLETILNPSGYVNSIILIFNDFPSLLCNLGRLIIPPDEDVGIEKNVHRLAVSKGGHEIVRHLIKIIMDNKRPD